MPDTHKVYYRQAQIANAPEAHSLEHFLRQALNDPEHGADYTRRTFVISDRDTKAFVHRSDPNPPGVFVELLQLDSRRALPFLQHPEAPTPFASILSRGVPRNEDHLGHPAYFLAIGNHLAVVESSGLRSPQIASYINIMLRATGQLQEGQYWKLVPRAQVEDGSPALARGLSRIVISPQARLLGDAPSLVEEMPKRRRTSRSAVKEEKESRGDKILQILEVLGVSQAEIEDIQSRMSTDLGFEARVVITVAKSNRKTTATIDASDIAEAIASMEDTSRVTVVSPDTQQRGNLVTLSRTAQISQDGGLLSLPEVLRALTVSLREWEARDIIQLDQE